MVVIRLGAALLLLCVALLPASAGAAEAPALVLLDPPAVTIGQGDTATISVRLENAQNVYGIDVRLRFDPAVIDVLDADAGKEGVQIAPGEFPYPDFIVLNAADNVSGTIKYASVQLNPRAPATGAGVIFSFQVRGKAAGRQTTLSVEALEMADRNGVSLPAQKQDGAVQVSAAAATPQPTATLPPAPTPTITLPPANTFPPSPTNTAVPATVVATPTSRPADQPTSTPAPAPPTATPAATATAAPATPAVIVQPTAPLVTATTSATAAATQPAATPTPVPVAAAPAPASPTPGAAAALGAQPAATASPVALSRQTLPAAPAASSESSKRSPADTLLTILGVMLIALGAALLMASIVWVVRARRARQ